MYSLLVADINEHIQLVIFQFVFKR